MVAPAAASIYTGGFESVASSLGDDTKGAKTRAKT
jgi:hypothetical protein